jgi:hypothetical protein
MVVHEVFLRLLLAKILERICPEEIAHEAMSGRLTEAVDALQVLQSVKLRAETTVDAQELLVHDGGQRKSTERLHAGLINGLGVFVLAFELEGEVICQMPAFVVSSEQP